MIDLGLKKELGLMEVFCISSGAMISSGLFILPALAYSKVGPAVIVSYAIASLLAIPTVLSKAELTTAMPKTGGMFFMTDRSMGPMMGTVGGLAAWFSLAFKSAFALLGIGIFMTILSPGLTDIQIKLAATAICIIFGIVNILGVKLAARFQTWMVGALILILIGYIISGFFFIDRSHYQPFTTKGTMPIISTAGLVFVSFAGSTKIAAVAGEVKKPGRNLPLGMILAWGVVSLLYILTITVTVGVLDPTEIYDPSTGSISLTPVSDGGGIIFGVIGLTIMSFAGLLAFVTTGNAGILAASRPPMAMGKDELLPGIFSRVSKRGTPHVSIMVTTLFMIAVILFLDLEQFVKTASTLKLTLFILANFSLIFMREGNMKHYRPKFKAPFYPWIQAAGIVGYALLITQMGWFPIITATVFVLLGLGWYFVYARGRIKREYALLHVAERVMNIKATDNLLDEELREIMIERDEIKLEKFLEKIDSAPVLDMNFFPSPDKFTKKIAYAFADDVGLFGNEFIKRFREKPASSNIFQSEDFIIISYEVDGRDTFEFGVIRTKKGAMFSRNSPPINTAFLFITSRDMENLYLNSLMWLVTAAERIDFRSQEWLEIEDHDRIREMMGEDLRKKLEKMK
ncbi:MAG: APC family permease [Thermoplasmatota archaeon]